jgi:hypothetical protein
MISPDFFPLDSDAAGKPAAGTLGRRRAALALGGVGALFLAACGGTQSSAATVAAPGARPASASAQSAAPSAPASQAAGTYVSGEGVHAANGETPRQPVPDLALDAVVADPPFLEFGRLTTKGTLRANVWLINQSQVSVSLGHATAVALEGC